MKGLKFIIACILSLTIIYVGAGASMSFCRCGHNMAATSESLCKCNCNELKGKAGHRVCCMNNEHKLPGKCTSQNKGKCCKTVIYKVDLQKDAPCLVFHMPAYAILSQHSFLCYNDLPTVIHEINLKADPPGAFSSRFYLNLYSTLLI